MLISIMFGQMDDAHFAHDKLCVPQANWAGRQSNSYKEIYKQGVSGCRGRLALMHTSTGDGKGTRLWVEVEVVVGKLCSHH